MGDKLRFGVVGTRFGGMVHIPSVNSHPSATVIAVCGRDPERTSAVAEKNNIPRYYTDYEQMIASDDLDAVVIATPIELHHSMAMSAIRAGLHETLNKRSRCINWPRPLGSSIWCSLPGDGCHTSGT